jgi:hypothetical protein
LLDQAFGLTGTNTQLIGKNLVDTGNALANFGPQAEKAFDTTAVKGFHDELIDLQKTLSTGFQQISGAGFSDFVVNELKKINIEVKATIDGIIAFREFLQKPLGTGFSDLNARFKEIDDNANRALQDVDANLKKVAQTGQQTGATFLQVGQSSATGFGQVGQHAQNATTQVNALNTAAGRTQIAVGAPATLLNNTFAQTINAAAQATAAINDLARDSSTFAERLTLQFQGFIPTQKTVSSGFTDAASSAQTATQRIEQDFQDLKTQLASGTGLTGPKGILPDASEWQAAFNKVKEIASSVWGEVQQVFQGTVSFADLGQAFITATSGLVNDAQNIWNQINSIFQKQIVIPAPVIQGGGSSGIPLARGGLVTGSGTGTSDSILARLSNYEFVINSAATQFYGPGLLAALNARIIPRDILPGFSMGGLVRAIGAMPGFAAGGGVNSSLRPITINIAGKGSFAGSVDAPEHIVAALSGEAVFEQIAAGGRSPGWRRT